MIDQDQKDLFNGLCCTDEAGGGNCEPMDLEQILFDGSSVNVGTAGNISLEKNADGGGFPLDPSVHAKYLNIKLSITGTGPFTLTEVTGFLAGPYFLDIGSYTPISGNLLQFFHPSPNITPAIGLHPATFKIKDACNNEFEWHGNVIQL